MINISSIASQSITASPSAEDLLTAAAAHGLLGRRDLLPGRARVVPDATATAYAVVVGTRRVAEVHWASTAPAAGRERRVLAVAASARLAPAPVAGEGTDVWTRGTAGVGLGERAACHGMPDLAAVCAAWGAALARLHQLPTRGVVGCSSTDPARTVGRSRALASSRLLAQVVADAADRWDERCWTHGRQSLESVLVGVGDDVVFRDWADGGVGDPNWDLAAACVAVVELADLHEVPAEVLESYLLLGYRGHGGPGRLDPGVRVAALVARADRLIETGDVASTAMARQLLDQAHRTAVRVARVGLAA